MMRRPAISRSSVLVLLAVAVAGLGFLAPSAGAASYTTSSYSSRLLTLVNDARAAHGLAALRLAGGTTTVAAAWTSHLAEAQALSHNPDLRHQLETHGSEDWTVYGENVGEGLASDPDGLFRAYMQSPEHRANILTRGYRYVGVAAVFTGKTAWNTFDFVDAYGTPATPSPVAAKPASRHHTSATRTATTATHPVTTPAPAAQSPAAAPATSTHEPVARPAHRHVAHHPGRRHAAPAGHVEIRGLTARLPGTVPATVVVASSETSPVPLAPRPTRALAVAVAVLLLSAAARRWTLTVARP